MCICMYVSTLLFMYNMKFELYQEVTHIVHTKMFIQVIAFYLFKLSNLFTYNKKKSDDSREITG